MEWKMDERRTQMKHILESREEEWKKRKEAKVVEDGDADSGYTA
eukprot:CAMPEP_0115025416 /NCGR_PEP_ID=MMETSP0216-20121206/33984_1 /TAXON_ID=223996 /ORGANISM="Protocruzia adherens, Strain Boccale" /LENGTH=43 /DNA_ID= /DNA_START= /DNA_END= /DNA_ORIENTATION=